MQYIIPFQPGNAYSLNAIFDVPSVPVCNFPWKDEYPSAPLSEARAAFFSDGIGVLLRSDEYPVRQELTEHGGPVHLDSCLEFFVNFTPDDSGDYLNFEFNPRGILHLAIGPGRAGRTKINMADTVSFFRISADSSPEGWQVSFLIPHEFIQSRYPAYNPASGVRAKGNFYKCGDNTPNPHFGCWSRVETPQPDFHRPEFFAPIISR